MAPAKRGDRVFIETRSGEQYEGTVSNIIRGFSVEIYNVFILTSKTEYPGTLSFYRDQVRLFKLISSDETGSLNNGNDISKRIEVHPEEFDRLRGMTTNFTFIDTFGKKFSDAVEVLSKRDSVAVAELDFTHVYIFDMLCLVHLRDLEDILKSKFITKVVHGGEVLYGCLNHVYNLKMLNVFDTQVVDSMSKRENNVVVKRNLAECLNYHLNFPLALLDTVMEEMYTKIWLQRPVSKTNKIMAAHLVAYLLTLRDHLMNNIFKVCSDATFQKYTALKQMTDLEILTKKMSLNRKSK